MEEGVALLQLLPKLIFCRSGLVGKGAPLTIMSPRAEFARGLLFSVEEVDCPSSNSTHKGFKVFSRVSWEGGLYLFPIMEDPSLRMTG